jgi:hypothetical protein
MEPDWFAMPTPPRTSGSSCSWAKPPLLTRVCCRSTAGRTLLLAQEETLFDLIAPVRALPACLRSHPQGRRAWPQPLYAAPVLLLHPWPSTCSRMACCLVRAHAYGIEPSRPPVEHSRSHPRTRQSNSARTASCRCIASPSELAAPQA